MSATAPVDRDEQEGREPPRSKGRRWGRIAAAAAVGVALVTAPWWGPRALSSLAFFRVRKVEIEGARYLSPSELVARLHVDTSVSIFDDVAPLAARLAGDPQVAKVEVVRKLPGTLVVRVTENLPIALVPGPGGALRAVDGAGRILPIDPSRVTVDVPVVEQRDTAVLRLLSAVRDEAPALYARISDARRVGKGELTLDLSGAAGGGGADGGAVLPVRAMTNVTVRRLTEIYPVEEDLARRQRRASELDLRYRDQVIARLQ
ncbi:MAG TPA: FtsQ-type POTRA domain-containing protein [Gemmatimonadaceae bacterium]|nr:FtsQ-type POTRA domain-containing protein [Gemmatimonadaceae bacterium]